MRDVTLKLTPGHGPGQSSIAYVSTSKDLYLTTAGADGKVFLRDSLILEPQQVAKVDTPPATIIAVDPKGKFLAVGDDQYVKVRVGFVENCQEGSQHVSFASTPASLAPYFSSFDRARPRHELVSP